MFLFAQIPYYLLRNGTCNVYAESLAQVIKAPKANSRNPVGEMCALDGPLWSTVRKWFWQGAANQHKELGASWF